MSIYDTLNPVQREAVFCTEGPLLVLAGAGSGKTRVLTHRVAYLIEEKGINPWNIMAITFTNKAAGEMRERVDGLVSLGAQSVWVSTFHSSCVRILRRHIDNLGYGTNFTIYDGDDQKTLMRQVMKKINLDPKQFRERSLLTQVSSAKDQLISPKEFERRAQGELRQQKVALAYQEYQDQMRKNNALDFDDLIVKTVELFEKFPMVLEHYQNRFHYIMVDEYQDTNTAQFRLVSLLAGKHGNLCVVGDDDQSIYRFRGANIENILSFEKAFPGAKVVKLEQNYRSTQNILNAANQVIRNNKGRKDKTLWTANEEGPLVQVRQYESAAEEARAIIQDIQNSGVDYQGCAVLYRTNAQSRLLEEQCLQRNIPYRLVGGVNFYQRKEIKDVLAYLKTISNGQDDLSVLRIVNVPKRGIGLTSVGRVTSFASEHGLSMYDAFAQARMVPGIGKTVEKITQFTALIQDFRSRLEEGCSIKDMIQNLLEETGYQQELEAEGEVESQSRLENIEELINKAVSYEEENQEPTLNGFLEEVALVADVDRMDDSENRVTLMTLHSAKGLEFPRVYLSGMDDGLFPSIMSISADDCQEVEEERRLCYVGITRARDFLMMTSARARMVNGETKYYKLSRFVDEIPPDLLDQARLAPRLGIRKAAGASGDSQLPWGKKSLGGIGPFCSYGNPYASQAGTSSFQPSFGKTFTIEKAESLEYKEGDRVNHGKFGQGTVMEIKDGSKDYEVTVEFDTVGVKRMFASFAKLQLVP